MSHFQALGSSSKSSASPSAGSIIFSDSLDRRACSLASSRLLVLFFLLRVRLSVAAVDVLASSGRVWPQCELERLRLPPSMLLVVIWESGFETRGGNM